MHDICIVGAGIAGASLAAVLGNKGFKVALVDRNWNEPDEIIGELLQPGGVQKLKELGLEAVLENIDAQAIDGYAMYLEQEWLTLSYNDDEQTNKEEGYGFRYGRFVQNLRAICQQQQSVDCVQGSVTSLLEDNAIVTGVEYTDPDKDRHSINARLTVVCRGSSSLLGKTLNKTSLDIKGFMLGLVIKDHPLPYEGRGHIILSDPAPILTYPVAKNKARVLIDFPKEQPAPKGSARMRYLLDKVVQQMPVELQDGFKVAVKEGHYKTKPTCRLPARPMVKEGVILLGDTLNIRHPITGGGMTVALTDVKALSDMLPPHGELESKDLKQVAYQFYRQRHRQNGTINILSFALYSVFKHRLLKKACFNYLKKGGLNAIEPMSILSCVSRNRLTLFKHFFAVAAFALTNRKSIKIGKSAPGIVESSRALLYSMKILFPLIIDEIPRVHRS